MVPRPAVPGLNPDLLGLLAGCRSAPADDTPRLILADWLDENADSAGISPDEARARAQFIRVQVELARPTFDTSRVVQLRAEEAKLLRAHAADWLGAAGLSLWSSRQAPFGFAAVRPGIVPTPPFDPLATGTAWKFDRGLLTLELTPAELTDDGFAHWFTTPLAAWVETAAVDVSGAEALERFSVDGRLRPYLGVRYAVGTTAEPSMRLMPAPAEAITPVDAKRLTRCDNFRLVRELTIYPAAVEGKVLAALITADVSGLRRLTLKAPLTDTDAAFLGITPLVSLSALDVSRCNLSALGFRDIVKSPHLKQLTSLVAFRNRFGDDGLAALAASPLAGRLTVLELQNIDVGDRGIRALTESPILERIVGPGLNLSMNPISDDGAAALAKCEHLSPFTELILRECRVGNLGAKALAESPYVANLVYLDLWKNRVGNPGAKSLAVSPHLGAMRELSLRDNAITDSGARALTKRFGKRVKV